MGLSDAFDAVVRVLALSGVVVSGAFLCCSSTAAAVEMSLPSVSGEPNDIVELPVSLTTVTNLQGYFFKLSYSTAVLEYVDAQPGAFAPWALEVNDLSPGTLTVAGAGSTPVSGSGTVAVLQFRIKPGASLGQSTSVLFQEAELRGGPRILDSALSVSP